MTPPTVQAGFWKGMGQIGAALATFGRSYRRFDWVTGEDERHVARTADGWNLALYRFRARGVARPFPVICSHGMAGSHYIYDLHPDCSLARFLAAAGFDVWLVDLRGRLDSWPDGGPDRALQWCFDDFVAFDFPAVLDRVLQLSGAPQAFWLGMEMSGQILYAAAIDGLVERLRGGVTCGSPVRTPASAQMPGVTSAPRGRKNGRVPYRGGSRFAGPVLAYGGFKVIDNSFRKCNLLPMAVARYFRNGIPDEATALIEQFTDWVRNDTMRSRDGRVVYSDRLAQVRLPLLVLVAEHDLQRPADAVQQAFEAFGSPDKTLVRAGTATGFSVDFGHDDLLAGLVSAAEVFPRIADWLAARSNDA